MSPRTNQMVFPATSSGKKKSVRLTVLESEVFYLSTEQRAAWHSLGSASSPASPHLAAAALLAASPGCSGQEDGPHP